MAQISGADTSKIKTIIVIYKQNEHSFSAIKAGKGILFKKVELIGNLAKIVNDKLEATAISVAHQTSNSSIS
jgi:hypothetical protein